ncbi:hypothetical protein B0H16DRAFT_1725721 [Mycena metata]|uniref:Uncharacterized protein n=1 Tax=Mycena metata TaxID=1033252 RepID=A0AAD7IQ40_9AGAR|nr:hypothetical protein B0H16DRAFT_1725721 [Mycena metata]
MSSSCNEQVREAIKLSDSDYYTFGLIALGPNFRTRVFASAHEEKNIESPAVMRALEADRSRIEDLDAQILQLERALSVLRGKRALVQERLGSYKYPDMARNSAIDARAVESDEVYIRVSQSFPCLDGNMALEILEDTPRTDNLARILELTVPHPGRWEHLELHSHNPSQLLGLDGPMPLLRRLHVTFADEDARAVPLLSDAPLLCTAVLDYIALKAVILPWGQLTSLTLERVLPSECTPVLKQTTNLLHCRLNLLGDGDPFEPVILSHLDSLILEDYENSIITGHLETFIVPALRHLEVAEMFLGSAPIASLQSFISQSGCRLLDVLIT